MNLRELLDESEMELLFTALEEYEKKCLLISQRPIQGYGKASEYEKKEVWKKKAERISELNSKIAETAN